MTCPKCDVRILDYVEDQLSPATRRAVEKHLAECNDCRLVARQLRHLDAALVSGIKTPALKADFGARLRQRIRAQPAPIQAAERAARKRELQAEYEARLARFRMSPLRWPQVLLVLQSSLAVFALAVSMAWPLIQSTGALEAGAGAIRSWLDQPGRMLLIVLSLSAAFAAIGWASRQRAPAVAWGVLSGFRPRGRHGFRLWRSLRMPSWLGAA